MKRITTLWLSALALSTAGIAFDVPMYDGTAPPMRTSKPQTHGKRGSRPLDERKARRANRRARRAGR